MDLKDIQDNDRLIAEYKNAKDEESKWRQLKNELLAQMHTKAEVIGATKLPGEKYEIDLPKKWRWDIQRAKQYFGEHPVYSNIFDQAYTPEGEQTIWVDEKIDGTKLRQIVNYGEEAKQMYESCKLPDDKYGTPKIKEK